MKTAATKINRKKGQIGASYKKANPITGPGISTSPLYAPWSSALAWRQPGQWVTAHTVAKSPVVAGAPSTVMLLRPCWECGIEGHFRKHCPLKTASATK